jgi:hypothetical protein
MAQDNQNKRYAKGQHEDATRQYLNQGRIRGCNANPKIAGLYSLYKYAHTKSK